MSIQNILHINWSCYHTWKKLKTFMVFIWLLYWRFWNNCFFSVYRNWLVSFSNYVFSDCKWYIASIALETYILSKQMPLNLAFKTAIGMSIVSMISMEVAMNITDVVFTGGAILTWWDTINASSRIYYSTTL